MKESEREKRRNTLRVSIRSKQAERESIWAGVESTLHLVYAALTLARSYGYSECSVGDGNEKKRGKLAGNDRCAEGARYVRTEKPVPVIRLMMERYQVI